MTGGNEACDEHTKAGKSPGRRALGFADQDRQRRVGFLDGGVLRVDELAQAGGRGPRLAEVHAQLLQPHGQDAREGRHAGERLQGDAVGISGCGEGGMVGHDF